jgi:hypothetical protein
VIFDDVTWLALTVVLTALGAAATVLLWRRRGPASGIRALAWTLLPAAAYLTGTLRLVGRITDAVASWATHLVFSPTVWIGVVVAGVSAALFVVAGGMRRHRIGVSARSARSALPGTGRKPAAQVEPDAGDDIEAILRKHGIS